MKHVIAFIALLIVDIPAIIFRGFVLTQLWGWFVVPLGADRLGIAHALGLSLMLGIFFAHIATKNDVKNSDNEWYVQAIGTLINSILASLFAWGVGAIIAGFM